MITALIQALDAVVFGQPHFFLLFFVYVWTIWLIKSVVSRFYREAEAEYATTASVVIPVFREDYSILDAVLSSVATNSPYEVIVVPNGPQDDVIVAIARRYATKVVCLPSPDKRNALAAGILEAGGDTIVIVDSDTTWETNTLAELLKPFADPRVCGVTTHQRISDPNRNLVRRFCDWMEDIRFTWSTPAQSVFGAVGCLPGRTIAFRRCFVLGVLEEFLNERCLGARLVTGDDRSLTNFALKQGWRTVYQRSSRVHTDCPNTWGEFAKQQLRWARSSQRETIRQIGWLIRRPFLAFCFLTDILTPFLLIAVLINCGWRLVFSVAHTPILEGTLLTHPLALVAVAAVGSLMSVAFRQIPHLAANPRDIWLLPAFIVVLTLLLTPIRIIGFMTMMAGADWMTRNDD